VLCTSRPSQAQAIGARKRFVFHVSVNPLKGDDIQALAHNPQGGTAWQVNQALSYHPYKDSQGNQPTKGYLQQAPYSFKTVAKALAYINLNFRTNNSNWYGVRYCNEVDIWLSTATNMQTFLGVNGTCIVPPGKTTNGKAPQVKLVRSPGPKELDALRASVAREIARRIKLGGKKKPDPKRK